MLVGPEASRDPGSFGGLRADIPYTHKFVLPASAWGDWGEGSASPRALQEREEVPAGTSRRHQSTPWVPLAQLSFAELLWPPRPQAPLGPAGALGQPPSLGASQIQVRTATLPVGQLCWRVGSRGAGGKGGAHGLAPGGGRQAQALAAVWGSVTRERT